MPRVRGLIESFAPRGTILREVEEVMAHAAAHLKKARELEQHPEYQALQKARERRRRQRERAERKRQVKHA